MKNYFETKVRYAKSNDESGKAEKTIQSYLIDAMSFTETEARIIKEISPFAIEGDVDVLSIVRTKYVDVVNDAAAEADKYYKVKLEFTTISEDNGKEKKTYEYYLVQASDINTARTNILAYMKDTISDFSISAISDTKILDVYECKLS